MREGSPILPVATAGTSPGGLDGLISRPMVGSILGPRYHLSNRAQQLFRFGRAVPANEAKNEHDQPPQLA